MRVEVLDGVERRRRWSRDDKMRIIEETLAPGAVVTEIARRHGISTSLVFTWRRRALLARVSLRRDRSLSLFSSPRLRRKASNQLKPQRRFRPESAGA